MAYFIFSKNSDDINGTIYRIAANQNDLNNLNINQSDYKIIEDSEENFNAVKLITKQVLKYKDNTITFIDAQESFKNKIFLETYVSNTKNYIKCFLDNNPNHQLFNLWNDYYNQLNNLDLNSIVYPLNKSLEQYFKDQNQISLNPLQIP